MDYPEIFTETASEETILKVLDVLGEGWVTGEITSEIMMGALMHAARSGIDRENLPPAAEAALSAFTTPPDDE